ncbi:MAG: hypothetical protein ACK5OX_15155 [Desertimonas sp.]
MADTDTEATPTPAQPREPDPTTTAPRHPARQDVGRSIYEYDRLREPPSTGLER